MLLNVGHSNSVRPGAAASAAAANTKHAARSSAILKLDAHAGAVKL